MPADFVTAVDKHTLGQIDRDDAHLFDGCPFPLSGDMNITRLAHRDAVGSGVATPSMSLERQDER